LLACPSLNILANISQVLHFLYFGCEDRKKGNVMRNNKGKQKLEKKEENTVEREL
jgi:hypothetical protein